MNEVGFTIKAFSDDFKKLMKFYKKINDLSIIEDFYIDHQCLTIYGFQRFCFSGGVIESYSEFAKEENIIFEIWSDCISDHYVEHFLFNGTLTEEYFDNVYYYDDEVSDLDLEEFNQDCIITNQNDLEKCLAYFWYETNLDELDEQALAEIDSIEVHKELKNVYVFEDFTFDKYYEPPRNEKLVIQKYCSSDNYNFNDYKEVEIIEWSDTLVDISLLFSGCYNLEKVTLPKDWKYIQIVFGLFSGCSKLEKIVFPDNWRRIRDAELLFCECDSLKFVELPAIINNYRLFAGCDLTVITDNEEFYKREFPCVKTINKTMKTVAEVFDY